MTANMYEPYQLEQILSLLNDQRECITLRSIMLELTVNRGVARLLLEEIVKQCEEDGGGDDDNKKYQVARMVSRRSGDGNMSRMELVTGSDNKDARPFSIALVLPSDDAMVDDDEDEVDENGNPIENNANNATTTSSSSSILEQLSAAHEKALATQRDKLMDGNEGELLEIFGDMSILPAPELCEENDEGENCVVRCVKRGRDLMQLPASAKCSNNGSSHKGGKASKFGSTNTSSSSAISTTITTNGKGKKGKPTTAAAFFSSQQTTKKKDKANKKDHEKKETKKESLESPTTEKENKANKSKNKTKTATTTT
ncbi:hypothetical protein ACHAXR_005526, partial [Thalassiosira sp. AJA248-18]